MANIRLSGEVQRQRMGRYSRWSVRIPRLRLAEVKRLALTEGWEVSDLIRTLVIMAATATWLGLRKEESLNRLKEIYWLGRIGAHSASLLRKPQTRPYEAFRGGPATDVVTLILPKGYAELIEAYAAAKRISKNSACENLLTTCLIAYMKAENTLLRALETIKKQAATTQRSPT